MFKQALVLEDIESVNHWLAERLRSVFADIVVDQAYSIKQANLLVKQNKNYDIALVDLGLPDGDGLELIEYFSQHNPKTISVVVTIFEDDQHLFKALQQGAQGYLLKDMQEDVFEQSLKNIANDEAVLSPLFTKKLMQYMRQIGQNTSCKLLPLTLPLTPRETEVLRCIGRGLQVSETAEQLNISNHTVSSYIKEIYRKLNICSRAEAVIVALHYGLI